MLMVWGYSVSSLFIEIIVLIVAETSIQSHVCGGHRLPLPSHVPSDILSLFRMCFDVAANRAVCIFKPCLSILLMMISLIGVAGF